MSAEELRESWQGRALLHARWLRYTELEVALLSLLADNYDDVMPFLLHAVFGSAAITAPFLCSNPKINKAGQIVADLIDSDGYHVTNFVIANNAKRLEKAFRYLADRLKLSDLDRIDLFVAIHHWVKADQRLDPAFDRRDPDARRMVLN